MSIIRIRRGNTTQWSSSTKVLQVGELGIDITLNKIKAGNGSSLWTDLPWLHTTPDDISILLQSANEYTDEAITSLGNTIDGSYVPISDVGGVDGVAPLDSNSLIPDQYIPSTIARDSELFSGSYNDLTNKPTLFDGDYTSLTNKPTLFSGAYNDLSSKPTLFSGSYTDLSDKPIIPSLTGYATETYVNTAVSNLVDTAPATLNTLNELAAALGNDANYATTISTALGNKLDSSTASSTYLTQTNASSTYLTQTNASSTYLTQTNASSTYLTQTNASSTYAPIASPTFTGTVAGITKSMVGLGNVDNTSDANKPVSTDTQTALNTKLDSSDFTYASITIPVYSTVGDLPSASSNHGRWAHVHGEGAMYFAHGGSWYKALSEENLKVSTNAQSGSYTVSTTDLDKMIEMSGGGTLTITDSGSFPVGFTCGILQTGSSQVTIAGSGFTVNGTPGLKLRAQWSSATLVKRGLNSWVLMGDLSA